eukprot:jgi/Botrbrau1/22906/Bobra.0065s0058.1
MRKTSRQETQHEQDFAKKVGDFENRVTCNPPLQYCEYLCCLHSIFSACAGSCTLNTLYITFLQTLPCCARRPSNFTHPRRIHVLHYATSRPTHTM